MGIELKPEEIDDFLHRSPTVILCVAREGKPPLPLPMWFGWVEGQIVMTTNMGSKKMMALRNHPEVSCLVESGEEYFTLKAVLVMGHCEIIEDQEEARHWQEVIFETKPIYRRLFPEKLPSHLERFYQLPRAVLRVTPTSITSWDFAKVNR